MVARLSTDGTAVGWAALDHIYERGALVGCGLNACRYDPAVSDGIASLLALDGAALVRGTLGESNAGGCARPFKLALGESPLIEFPTTRGIFFGERAAIAIRRGRLPAGARAWPLDLRRRGHRGVEAQVARCGTANDICCRRQRTSRASQRGGTRPHIGLIERGRR